MTHDDLMSRLWWLRRATADDVATRLLVEPVPTTEEEVEARLPDMEQGTVAQIAECLLRE